MTDKPDTKRHFRVTYKDLWDWPEVRILGGGWAVALVLQFVGVADFHYLVLRIWGVVWGAALFRRVQMRYSADERPQFDRDVQKYDLVQHPLLFWPLTIVLIVGIARLVF